MPRSPLINYFDSRILGTSTFILVVELHSSVLKILRNSHNFIANIHSTRFEGFHKDCTRIHLSRVMWSTDSHGSLIYRSFPWKFGKIKTHCLSQRGIAATGHRWFSASSPTSWIYRPPPVSSLSPLPVHHAARSCHDPRTLAGTRKGKGTMKRWKEGREEGGGGRTARRETSEQRAD